MDTQTLVSADAMTETAAKPGEMLRELRQRLNLTEAEVAVQLNLSPHIIALIEADNFAKLPGHTFVRGYLRAYAKLLGISAEEIINAFNSIYPDTRERAPLPQRNYQHSVLKQKRQTERSVKFVGYAILAVMLILMILWWHNHSNSSSKQLPNVAIAQPTQTSTPETIPNAAAAMPVIGPGLNNQTQMTVVVPMVGNVQQAVTNTPVLKYESPAAVTSASDNTAVNTTADINQTIANAAAVPGINNHEVNVETNPTGTQTSNQKPQGKTNWNNPDL